MALQDITDINISLQNAAVTSTGFGTPLFITNDQRFEERIRSYSGIDEVGEDFATTDNAYIGANSAFSQEPAPNQVKIGRRGDTTTTLTPQDVAEDVVYTFTVLVNDGTSVEASHTAAAGEDAEAICTALKAVIDAQAAILEHVTVAVVGSDVSGVLTITPNTTSDTYWLNGENNLTLSGVSTEPAADSLTAIGNEDMDWYFIATDNHEKVYALSMAAAAESRTVEYFVSSSASDNYSVLTEASTDLFAELADNNYFRTSAWYHNDADTAFPEMGFIATASPSVPGTKIWANNAIKGISASKNEAGFNLTSTQTTNLDRRNANYIIPLGGVDITSTGKVSGNEKIHIIRERDYYVAKLTEAYQYKFIVSPKVTFTDSGINEMRSVFRSVSERLRTTPGQPNVLDTDNPYVDRFPGASAVPVTDKQAGVLNATFTAYLSGAIQAMKLDGILTYQGQ